MARGFFLSVFAFGVFTTFGCGDNIDVAGNVDGRQPDAPPGDIDAPMNADAGDVDAPAVDAAPVDAPGADAGMADAGMADAGMADAAPMADRIQDVIDATDGPVSVTLNDVLVTYVKSEPAVGTDQLGFFVQAQPSGPAVFIGVDPGLLIPVPSVDDVVSFTVTMKNTFNSVPLAEAITGFSRSTTDDASLLVQEVSNATDLVSALDDYTSELITVSGTIVSDFAGSGQDHLQATVETAGITGENNLRLRLPTALVNSLDLENGCTFTVTETIMWRTANLAQISAYNASELSATCAAPRVLSAAATSSTEVAVRFSRSIDPASVAPNGSQFTFNPPLNASAATVVDNLVLVTTDAQNGATTYTVTVDAGAGTGVADFLGTVVDPAANTAMFQGFVASPPTVIINEVDYDQPMGDTQEFIELFNPGTAAVSLADLAVVLINGSNNNEYDRIDISGSGTLGPGEYLVLANTGVTVPGGVTRIDIPNSSVQQGPDGIVVVNLSTEAVLDALSYEGAIKSATITGFSGTVNLVEGTPTPVSDPGLDGSMIRLPNGFDSDNAIDDWAFTDTPTPGAPNN